jgi:tRNA A37 methylthiotransferase MiaB
MKLPSYVFLDSAHWSCLPSLIAYSRIYRFLIENGHIITSIPSKADFIIISSCGVLKNFENRTVGLYHKYYPITNKKTKIIIYGCLVKTNWKKLQDLDILAIGPDDDYKLNDLFFSNIKFESINPICSEETKKEIIGNRETHVWMKSKCFIATRLFLPFSRNLKKKYYQILKDLTHSDRMFVEISKGCIGNCSYCIIKKAKGNLRSRKINDIIHDIEEIYDPSKTLFLVADDCGCYGKDIGSDLTELINQINKKFPNITIDLNYLNPEVMQRDPKEQLSLFKNANFKYVIIPIQSGSNKIIKKMNRRYDPKRILKITDQIKKISPSTILYAHFIVGFPGENIIDFIKTLCSTLHFDIPLPFKYIPMKGSELSNVKNFIGSIRLIVFMVFVNLVILSKISAYKINK